MMAAIHAVKVSPWVSRRPGRSRYILALNNALKKIEKAQRRNEAGVLASSAWYITTSGSGSP